MRHPSRKVLAALTVIIVLLLLGARVWFGKPAQAKLSVAYIKKVADHGHWQLQFGITNIGKCTVFTSTIGRIHVLNHRNAISVVATPRWKKLAPGEGLIVDVALSEAKMHLIDGKWRFTCLCARDGLRSRIYLWQWGPNGPGARVNWLIPKTLKGIPLTVKARSEWIKPLSIDATHGHS